MGRWDCAQQANCRQRKLDKEESLRNKLIALQKEYSDMEEELKAAQAELSSSRR